MAEPEERGPRRRRRPPSPALLFAEPTRALMEGMTLGPSAALLRRAQRGDGHPVMVLPGFTAGDTSTRALRGYLKQQGFRAHPWLQGRNLGPRDALPQRMAARLAELSERHGRKVSLLGWSLGGIYARELAKRLPDRVRQVVTLGSPFADVDRPTNVTALFDWFSDRRRRTTRSDRALALREPPPMPSTAIYSRTDGVVHWSTCLEPETDHTENIPVPGSHSGLGFNPLVLYAVADRLSQPEGEWTPFERSGWRRHLYR
ncbi:MAG: alpha/beta hydrolase [Myxococcota bacterium]|nr:alpha/beta hydrolase [Myxococcota bacterium]